MPELLIKAWLLLASVGVLPPSTQHSLISPPIPCDQGYSDQSESLRLAAERYRLIENRNSTSGGPTAAQASVGLPPGGESIVLVPWELHNATGAALDLTLVGLEDRRELFAVHLCSNATTFLELPKGEYNVFASVAPSRVSKPTAQPLSVDLAHPAQLSTKLEVEEGFAYNSTFYLIPLAGAARSAVIPTSDPIESSVNRIA